MTYECANCGKMFASHWALAGHTSRCRLLERVGELEAQLQGSRAANATLRERCDRLMVELDRMKERDL